MGMLVETYEDPHREVTILLQDCTVLYSYFTKYFHIFNSFDPYDTPVRLAFSEKGRELCKYKQFLFIVIVAARPRIQATLKGKAKCWAKRGGSIAFEVSS